MEIQLDSIITQVVYEYGMLNLDFYYCSHQVTCWCLLDSMGPLVWKEANSEINKVLSVLICKLAHLSLNIITNIYDALLPLRGYGLCRRASKILLTRAFIAASTQYYLHEAHALIEMHIVVTYIKSTNFIILSTGAVHHFSISQFNIPQEFRQINLYMGKIYCTQTN